MIRKSSIAAVALIAPTLMLAACGETRGERAISGAGIGAATGAVGAAIVDGGIIEGAVVGAVVGGVVGAVTDSDQIDLGSGY